MNKREKEVLQLHFQAEEDVIAELEKQYRRALNDIDRKIRLLMSDDLTQSKIYQIEYQKALRGQIEGILEKLHGDEFSTIQKYLHDCYEDGFIGTVYDIAGQGIPLIMPIDQAAAVKAIMTDSKVSNGLYNALGVDVKKLKSAIRQEITRGISTGMLYDDIARNISEVSKAPMSRAKTIARTEGHRIQQSSAYDAQQAAKKKGADVLKQWDSTMDGATRPIHRELDGQIREVDEPFSAHGKKAMFPGDFGDPAEDCNCRCASLTRARWGLDESELQTLKNRAKYFGLDKTKDFEEFKGKFLNAAKYESGLRSKINIQLFAMPKDANAKKVDAFKKDLASGNVNLKLRTQKQNEHIAGTRQWEDRLKRDQESGRVSTYFYEGTDVEALISGLHGTGVIQYDSEKSLFPVEFISLEKPVGKAYNYGTKKWVDVSRIAIQYGSNGVHAYPVKDW